MPRTSRPTARQRACEKGGTSLARTFGSKLHAVCDGKGRPIILPLSEGQTSDYRGAATMLPALPSSVKTLIGGKGYDSDLLRNAIEARGIEPWIPPRRGLKNLATYCKRTYKRRDVIERMFAARTFGSARSKTSAVSPPGTIAAPRPSSQPSSSPRR